MDDHDGLIKDVCVPHYLKAVKIGQKIGKQKRIDMVQLLESMEVNEGEMVRVILDRDSVFFLSQLALFTFKSISARASIKDLEDKDRWDV